MTTKNPETDVILQELAAVPRDRYGDRYVRLWLYGSEARGDAPGFTTPCSIARNRSWNTRESRFRVTRA